MTANSYFFYYHKELSGQQDVWKIGITSTPFSAVRARQRYMVRPFSLDKVFFGRSEDIVDLERRLKKNLENYAVGSYGQTELFKIPLNDLEGAIGTIIGKQNLDVSVDNNGNPYCAFKSADCPIGVPSEVYSEKWCESRAKQMFGLSRRTKQVQDIFQCNDIEVFNQG
jgi:hypothetical protein